MANRNKARKEWDNTMQEMAANAGKELKLGGKSKAGKRVTRKCRPLPKYHPLTHHTVLPGLNRQPCPAQSLCAEGDRGAHEQAAFTREPEG